MKTIFFIWIVLKFVHKCPSDNVTIGSGNGVVPNKGQAITWTNGDSDP